MQNNTQNCEVRKGHLGDETSPILPTSPILVPFALVSQDAKGEGVDSRPGRNPVSVSMPRRGIQEDENSPGRYRDTHACRGYFQSSLEEIRCQLPCRVAAPKRMKMALD